jgi:hypothetical protein
MNFNNNGGFENNSGFGAGGLGGFGQPMGMN